MVTILWIQNSDENKDDYVFENFELLNEENIVNQQKHISNILAFKKKSKELSIERNLKINNLKRNYLIDMKSDDLDCHGRMGAVMIFVKDYQEEHDEEILRNELQKIFSTTSTVVPEQYIDHIFGVLKKKKRYPIALYVSIATIILLILLITILILNESSYSTHSRTSDRIFYK